MFNQRAWGAQRMRQGIGFQLSPRLPWCGPEPGSLLHAPPVPADGVGFPLGASDHRSSHGTFSCIPHGRLLV